MGVSQTMVFIEDSVGDIDIQLTSSDQALIALLALAIQRLSRDSERVAESSLPDVSEQ
jgi:hypothetical protein